MRKNRHRCFDLWLSTSAASITRAEVQQQMNTLGKKRGHHTANRAYDDLRAVFSWGIKYGRYMAMNNQSLQIIGKVLGHKSPTATQIYSRLAFDPLKHAMEAAQASTANSADILPPGLFKKKRKPGLKRVKSGGGLTFVKYVYHGYTYCKLLKPAGLTLCYYVNYGYTTTRKAKPSSTGPP